MTRGGRVAGKSVVMSVRWQQCPAVDATAPSLLKIPHTPNVSKIAVDDN